MIVICLASAADPPRQPPVCRARATIGTKIAQQKQKNLALNFCSFEFNTFKLQNYYYTILAWSLSEFHFYSLNSELEKIFGVVCINTIRLHADGSARIGHFCGRLTNDNLDDSEDTI